MVFDGCRGRYAEGISACGHDANDEIVLDVEDLVRLEGAFVSFDPQLGFCDRVGQLHGDAQPGPSLPDAAVDHVTSRLLAGAGGDDPKIAEARNVTYATFCQGSYEESARYRDFMGWDMPWYSARDSLDALLVGRPIGLMHLVCYVRRESEVFETYWTTRRGVEAMDNSYRLLDLTVYGRQEDWED